MGRIRVKDIPQEGFVCSNCKKPYPQVRKVQIMGNDCNVCRAAYSKARYLIRKNNSTTCSYAPRTTALEGVNWDENLSNKWLRQIYHA